VIRERALRRREQQERAPAPTTGTRVERGIYAPLYLPARDTAAPEQRFEEPRRCKAIPRKGSTSLAKVGDVAVAVSQRVCARLGNGPRRIAHVLANARGVFPNVVPDVVLVDVGWGREVAHDLAGWESLQ